MKRCLVALFVTIALAAGVLASDSTAAPEKNIVERWVNANLLRIHVNGRWEEIPLVPLADHLCRSKHRLFRRYCGDELLAPQAPPLPEILR